jgi:hypothetical protein
MLLPPLWPPLWSSGQSSWQQILRSGFDSRRYQILWVVVGLERGPLRLVSTIEELLGRKRSGFGLENLKYGRGDPLCWPLNTLYPQKLALSPPTSGGHWVGIVRSRTKATELCFLFCSLFVSNGLAMCRCFIRKAVPHVEECIVSELILNWNKFKCNSVQYFKYIQLFFFRLSLPRDSLKPHNTLNGRCGPMWK